MYNSSQLRVNISVLYICFKLVIMLRILAAVTI